MMKNLSAAHCIRKALLSAVAALAIISPLLATASTPNDSVRDKQNTRGNPDLMTIEGQKRLYRNLRAKARKSCGPTSIRTTGSLGRAIANKKCYEDTLAIAVLRLDNSAITALWQD